MQHPPTSRRHWGGLQSTAMPSGQSSTSIASAGEEELRTDASRPAPPFHHLDLEESLGPGRALRDLYVYVYFLLYFAVGPV
jgi:hypothetical protein